MSLNVFLSRITNSFQLLLSFISIHGSIQGGETAVGIV